MSSLPPPPDQSGLKRRVPLVGAVIATLLGLTIGYLGGATAAPTEASTTVAAAPETVTLPPDIEPPSPSEVPEPEPTASEPQGDFKLASCDWSGGYGDNGFIGSVRVINTGDVPLRANVSFTWLFGDGSKVHAEPDQKVDVQPGQSELVFFTTNATVSSVGLFQDHPDYQTSKNCEAKATIV